MLLNVSLILNLLTVDVRFTWSSVINCLLDIPVIVRQYAPNSYFFNVHFPHISSAIVFLCCLLFVLLYNHTDIHNHCLIEFIRLMAELFYRLIYLCLCKFDFQSVQIFLYFSVSFSFLLAR